MLGVTQAIYGWLAGSRHLMDVRSLFYSAAMLRVDEDSLALHLEVSLATAEPALVTNIGCGDTVARRRATAELARHLAVRLRCYDILADEPAARSDTLPLFPEA
ncbi:hypothetical protein V473_21355 [Sphingobium cupriresistens LL01]|uniref:Uncharacterized protein n=1 Tax=Sphingobium cupriresistens LL01 TaxID=1420583 RepID=A0A0J7XL58_9SPHN|nr:hypothetical protein V473_21355 [Sphingobium cupriresistens LL01]